MLLSLMEARTPEVGAACASAIRHVPELRETIVCGEQDRLAGASTVIDAVLESPPNAAVIVTV